MLYHRKYRFPVSFTEEQQEYIENLAARENISMAEAVRRLIGAAMEIRTAVLDEGTNPAYHQATMLRHKREWPTLWRAIGRLIK